MSLQNPKDEKETDLLELIPDPPLDPTDFSKLKEDRFDIIHLYLNDKKPTTLEARYTLRILDRPLSSSSSSIQHPCAVFLVPTGRENDYVFSTRRGLLNVAESASTVRLIAASMGRDQDFGPSSRLRQECIQMELKQVVQIIAQRGIFLPGYKNRDNGGSDFSIPFMVVEEVGQRHVIAKGETETTGPFFVEEIQSQKQQNESRRMIRRLYFSSNPNVVQTEVIMKDNQGQVVVDPWALAFSYHWQIVAGWIALMSLFQNNNNNNNRSILIVGLGGGALVNFFHHWDPAMTISAVELEPDVLHIAKTHFGFLEHSIDNGDGGGSVVVQIGDGLTIQSQNRGEGNNDADHNLHDTHQTTEAEEEANQNEKNLEKIQNQTVPPFDKSSISLIVIDVDSKDRTVGMSCPPVPFVSVDYLKTLHSILDDDHGILAINVSARDPAMLEIVQKNLACVFSANIFASRNSIASKDDDDSDDDLNVVLFATKHSTHLPLSPTKLLDAVQYACESNHVPDANVLNELEECVVSLVSLSGQKDDMEARKKSNSGGRSGGKKKGGTNKKKKGKKR